MYTVSNNYKAKIKEASRTFSIKVTIGSNTYTNADISSITLEGNIQPGQGFTIGNTTSKMLKITFINKDTLDINNTKLNLMVGVLLNNGTYEYIPFKNYNIDKKETNDFTTSITCYDNMILLEKKYVCSLTFPISLSTLVNNILSGTGISCVTSLPSINIPSNITGKTKREWVGYIASYLGANAVINRDGNLEFKLLNDISSSYKIENGVFNLTKEQEEFKIEAAECTANNTDIISGSDNETASVTKFNNPWMDKARLDTIAPNIINIKYLGYSMKWQGDPALDIGDIITFTDKKGNEIVSPILNYKINLAGVTAEMSAKGETVLRNNTESTGTQQSQIDNINSQLGDYVTNDNLDSALDSAIEDKDLVSNSDLDNKLGDYATNDDLSDYATEDEVQQALCKQGENLIVNGDFNNYRYNPDGMSFDSRAKWQIMHWFSYEVKFLSVDKTNGLDGGCCLHQQAIYYGSQVKQGIDLSSVEGKYLLIQAYVKINGPATDQFFYLFADDFEIKQDFWGENYVAEAGNRIPNNNISYAKGTLQSNGWYYLNRLIEIPEGAKFFSLDFCNGYEWWLDKVSVKAQTDGTGYNPNQQDERDNSNLKRQVVNFAESDWTTIVSGGSSYGSKASKSLSLNNPLQSTNVNCAFINDDAGCMELVNWSTTNSKITVYNDRVFNGHVIIECFDR